MLTHMLTQEAGRRARFLHDQAGSNRVGGHLERIGIKAAVIHGIKSLLSH
jgi:hypothetical protein